MLKFITVFIFISLSFPVYTQDDLDPEEKKEVVFNIKPEIQKKHAELIELIKATDSMDDDKRQHWFDIMPSMTEEQINKLFIILETERKKLEALEKKYQKEIMALNEKHLIEWSQFQTKEDQNKFKDKLVQDILTKHNIKNIEKMTPKEKFEHINSIYSQSKDNQYKELLNSLNSISIEAVN